MPLIERYVLRRTTQIFVLTLGALTAALWVIQVLRQIDVVTAKGQTIWVFFLITVLSLPGVMQAIAPIAFAAAAIISLSSLTNDSELPVIAAAGASRATINRPILVLAIFVTLGVSFACHVLTPASLGVLREVITRVRADVITTLVQDGGFRVVADGFTVHIREKAPDGSFRDIFVDDERDPNESLQYSAKRGVLIERPTGSFLVLQDGNLVSQNHAKKETRVVDFATYAIDLSLLGSSESAVYHAKDRSTLYLLDPPPDDVDFLNRPQRIAFELNDRIAEPLYALAFAFLTLAFLGRPRTSRQDRTFATVSVVYLAVLMRALGFAASAVARSHGAAIPFLYAIPVCGIGFGLLAMFFDARLPIPRFVEAGWDRLAAIFARPRGDFALREARS